MFVVKQVLALNNAKLDILPRIDNESVVIKGIEYENNRFTIIFPKNLVI